MTPHIYQGGVYTSFLTLAQSLVDLCTCVEDSPCRCTQLSRLVLLLTIKVNNGMHERLKTGIYPMNFDLIVISCVGGSRA